MKSQLNPKKKFFLIIILFLIISIFVISKIVLNDQLIGRSLDFNVAPASDLVKNTYLMNFYEWWGTMNGGGRNSFGATLVPINIILFFPALLGSSSWFVSRYQIVLTLFLAMLFFYLLARKLLEDYKMEEAYKTALSITGALFFTLNNYFFNELIFGSNAQYLTFSFVPLLIYSVISHFKTKKKIFFWIALFSIIIISSTLQRLVMAYVFLALLSFVYKDFKFIVKLGLLHFLLSLYWIVPLMYVSQEIKKGEVLMVNYEISLKASSPKFLDTLINKEYFFGRNSYNFALNSVFLSKVWFINAFTLLIASLTCLLNLEKFKKIHKKLIIGFFLIFLLSILLIKGANKPFGDIVVYLYYHFFPFSLFRSLQHYIGFYVMVISVLFVFSGFYLIKINKKSLYLLILLVFVNAMPWWYTLDLGTKNIVSNNLIPSYFGQFYLTEGNKKMYDLNSLPLQFGILHLPPGFSVFFLASGKNEFNFITRDDPFTQEEMKVKTQGADAGLYYGNKKFYATDAPKSDLRDILDEVEKAMYIESDFFDKNKNLFSLLNIRYFVLREDVRPLYSKNYGLFNIKNIQQSISSSDSFSQVVKEDFITIIKTKDFLPYFYTPKNIIKTNKDIKKLLEITSDNKYQIRSAVYFAGQNEDIEKSLKKIPEKIDKTPLIEFRKINPTKYKVIVHNASDSFPLVLGESFHPDWKVYVMKSQITNHKSQTNLKLQISNSRTLRENDRDEASEEETEKFIEKGWLSSLGSKFISKNFHDTIQNDNLPKGYIWDTWFKKSLSEENHQIANGYANSWIISPYEFCSSKKCVQNSDGTYNFELIVEFWPQRLFYLGSLISISVLLIILGFSLKKKSRPSR